MIPFYRFIEIAVYSLLNFCPYIALALYPFRHHFRFSKPVTYGLAASVSLIQVGIGIWVVLLSKGEVGLISILSTLIYFLFYFTAVKAHFGKTLFTLLFLSNVGNLVVMMSKCLEGVFFPDLALQSYRWSFSLMMVLVETVILIPLFYYIRHTYSSVFEEDISKPSWRFLWLIPATFYLIWYYHLYFQDLSSLQIALQPETSVFLLLINLGAILIYHMVVQHMNIIRKNMELAQQNYELAMQRLQYDILQERVTGAKQACHDLRQHLLLLSALLADQKYNELAEYLKGYKEMLPEDCPAVFCQNYTINTLLSYFSQQARNAQVDFQVKLELPEYIGIPDEAISVILGSLLENAIEACKSTASQPRRLSVKGVCDSNGILFKIQNTHSGNIKRAKNGDYLSTKRKGPGIGLASVKNITAQYDGILEIQCTETLFTVTVMLTLPKE